MDRKAVSGIMLTLISMGLLGLAFNTRLVAAAYYYNLDITVIPESPTDSDLIEIKVSFDAASISYGVTFGSLSQVDNQFYVGIIIDVPQISLWMIGYAEKAYHLGTLPVDTYSFNVNITVTGYGWGNYHHSKTFSVAPSQIPEPTTWTVDDDGPADFLKIQDAINAANPEDTIFVHSGTYYENVVMDKTLSLVGENRSNTIIDGNRNGIVVWVQADNAVITNFTIRNGARIISNFMVIPGNGISIGSSGCTITENIMTNNTDDGICIYATYCTIVGNIIANNGYIGIEIKTVSIKNPASGNILRDNSMINNTYNFGVQPLRPGLPKLAPFIQDIDTSNTVNGKPIYYWVNEQDKQVPPDAGYVAIINSTNITVKNLNLTNSYEGVLIAYSNNTLIDNVNIPRASRGIAIYSSNHNNVSASTILDSGKGISLEFSNNNAITDSKILGSAFGVFLEESINNLVSGNTITASYSNIWITYSHYNQICQNRVSGSSYSLSLGNSHNDSIEKNLITRAHKQGVSVYDSNGNTIIYNTIELNTCGIYFCRSTGNVIYHNNFINNTEQAFDHIGGNTYDNGYPSGGNYWSDYSGVDKKSGPNQDELGSDGMGDTPYTPHHNIEDRYPLMEPWSPKPPSPVEATQELIETIETWKLTKGTENSLKARLKVAIHMLDLGKEDGAIRKLTAFINRVEVLREKKLTNEQADYLATEAQRVIDLING